MTQLLKCMLALLFVLATVTAQAIDIHEEGRYIGSGDTIVFINNSDTSFAWTIEDSVGVLLDFGVATPNSVNEYPLDYDDEEGIGYVNVRSNRSHNNPVQRIEAVCDDDCFVTKTTVATPTGPIAIEDIKAGDRVAAPTETGTALVSRVTKTQALRLTTITVNDERIQVTSGHRFDVVGRGWTAARSLKPGDVLAGMPGKKASVVDSLATETLATPMPVYNLHLIGAATFHVGASGIAAEGHEAKPDMASVHVLLAMVMGIN